MSVYIFYILLLFTTLLISWQDFRERMVSLWLLVIYFINTAVFTYIKFGWLVLFENGIGTLTYFGICFAVIFLYYFIKERKWPQIVDSKIGKADLLIFLGIGISLPLVSLIIFFTLAFSLSVLVTLLFFRDKKQVPLAGILVLFYLIFDIFSRIELF